MNFEKFSNIRIRLPLMFIVMVLVPTILIILIFSKIELKGDRERILNQLESVVTLKKASINVWVRSLKADLASTLSSENTRWNATVVLSDSSSMELLFDTSHSKIELSFLKQLKQTRRFNSLLLINLKGEVLFSTLPELEDRVFNDQEFFRQGQQAFFISPTLHLLSPDYWSLVASQPVFDDKGHLVGVVAGIATMGRLNEIMSERAGLGETGETYLIDQDFTLLTGARFDKDKHISVETEGTQIALTQGNNGFGLYNDYRGKPVVEVYHHLPDLGVVILAKQDQSEAFQSTYTALRFMMIITVIILGIAVLVGSVFTRNITVPLSELAHTAEQISTGNWDVMTTIARNDEIGDLAKAFNLMTATVKDNYHKIRTQNVELIEAHKGLEVANVKLEEHAATLEQNVADRTVELNKSLKQLAQQHSQLKTIKEQAVNANLAKSEFLANMSHELRTPLNAILGFSELMSRDPSLSAEQLGNLGTIGQSGEHLLSLINDVLELSKIEAGRIVLQQENFDLHRLLLGLEEMFRLRSQQKGLSLDVERRADVPQYIWADKGKLRQVLINLLGNAVKFTTQGGIKLRVKNDKSKTRTLVFEVEDTGDGIAPDELSLVFDAFYQGTGNRQSQQGTGLGIPISHRFVRMMGGDLTVSSKVGTGTVFHFDVKIEIVDAADAASLPIHRVIGLEPDQQQYRLLVVEDNDTSRKLLVKLLQIVGFEVQAAVNGQEAIEIWKKWQPHLIWMDIRMPVMDGYEAIRSIRALPGGGEAVIIALTAHAFEEDRIKVLENGCNDFVSKPFREKEIFEVMQKYLGVQYLYEDREPHERVEKVIIGDEQMVEAIDSLPAALHMDLCKAVKSLDLEKAMAIVELIREKDQDLAEDLAELLNSYRFDTLQKLFEENK